MDKLETARAALREVADSRERVADAETAAIIDALRIGLGPVEIGQLVGRSREHVRKIDRLHKVTDRARPHDA